MGKKKQVTLPVGKRYDDMEPCIAYITPYSVMLGSITDDLELTEPGVSEQEEFGFASFFDIPDNYNHMFRFPNTDIIGIYAGKCYFGLKRESIEDVVQSLSCKNDTSISEACNMIYQRMKEVINTDTQYPYVNCFQFEKAPKAKDDVNAFSKEYTLTYAEVDFTDSYEPVKAYRMYEPGVGYCKKQVWGLPGMVHRMYYELEHVSHNVDGFPVKEGLNFIMETFEGNVYSMDPLRFQKKGQKHILAFTPYGCKWYKNGHSL